jgi:hypothetical protein
LRQEERVDRPDDVLEVSVLCIGAPLVDLHGFAFATFFLLLFLLVLVEVFQLRFVLFLRLSRVFSHDASGTFGVFTRVYYCYTRWWFVVTIVETVLEGTV